MIIDVHSHLAYHKIFPPRFTGEVADTMTGGDEKQRKLVDHLVKLTLGDKDGSVLLGKDDDAGIDKAVLLIADFGVALGEPELDLESIFLLHKEVMDASNGRYLVFGGVDPRRGEKGVELFRKSIEEYGFSGLKLYPPCGFELDDKGLYPLYEICSRHRLPVLTHTGPSLESLRTERRYPATILQVADEFRDINFILAHAGARDCATTIDIVRQRPNVYFDISTFQRFMDDEAIAFWMRKFCDVCPDRILFGTDWPMFALSATQKQLVNKIDGIASLTDAEKELIFYKNAAGLLPI